MSDETKAAGRANASNAGPQETPLANPRPARAPSPSAELLADGGNADPGAMVPKVNRASLRSPASAAPLGSPPATGPFDLNGMAAAMAAAQAALHQRSAGQLPTEGMDRTVPGGRYKVDGRWVNAMGDPLPDQSESGD